MKIGTAFRWIHNLHSLFCRAFLLRFHKRCLMFVIERLCYCYYKKNKKNESNINRFTCFKSIYIEFINIHNKVSLYILSVVEVQLDKIR
ncbi:hypothetical protein CN491_10455 [Bacillus cereus]|uniref:Uncharacterized protein n=1 Tax=Bacillus cereus TaxID=1396 RepID=A0A2C1F576_BACCE|nr:hypothetical protein CN491_10455 [Bacillus cereus]PFP79036.1 hypothetical protein COJ95_10930 [Bacillus cereus]PGT20032.1 hypothetical protein COC96_03465 [Bacillus cereus]